MSNLSEGKRIQRHLSLEEKRAKMRKPDLTLIIGDFKDECHTLLVSKASPVLEALRRWENEHDKIIIDFKTSFEAADLVMNFIYGYKVTIPDSILSSVLRLSNFLLIDELANFCISLVKENKLRVATCLKTLFNCSLYGIEFERLIDFIRGNLFELLYKQDMLHIDESSLKFLLCDETLSYLPRFEWLRFVIQWCKFTTERRVLFPDLLKLVDLNKIRRSFLQDLLQNEDLLEELPQCKESYDQAVAKEDSERTATMVLITSTDKTFVLDIHTGCIYESFLQNIGRFQNTTFCNGLELGYVDIALMKVYIGRMPSNPDAQKRISMEIQWHNDEIENPPHVIRCFKNDNLLGFLGKKMVKSKRKDKKKFKIFVTAEIYILHVHKDGVLQANPFLSFRFDKAVNAVMMDNKLYLFRIYANKYFVHLISLMNCRMKTQEISFYFQKYSLHFDICVGDNEHIIVKTDKMKVILNADTLEVKSVKYFNQLSGVQFQIDKELYSFSTYNRRIEYLNHSREKRYHAEIPKIGIGHSRRLKVLMPVTIDQTGSLCHVKCPHCDTGKEERIQLMEERERERQRKEEELRKIRQQTYIGTLNYDIYSEEYDSYDDYRDSDNDDYYGFDKTEYFWDGSADEFVEAWW